MVAKRILSIEAGGLQCHRFFFGGGGGEVGFVCPFSGTDLGGPSYPLFFSILDPAIDRGGGGGVGFFALIVMFLVSVAVAVKWASPHYSKYLPMSSFSAGDRCMRDVVVDHP